MDDTKRRLFSAPQRAIVALALALLLSLPAIKLSVLSVSVAFARQQHHQLATQEARVTQTEVKSGHAAAQDGGYPTSGPCILHVRTAAQADRQILMPCSSFSRFETGEQVTLVLANDRSTVVQVEPYASDGIETSWGWNNGLWAAYAVVVSPFLVAVVFYCSAWLVRHKLRRRMRIGFAVTIATLAYWAIAFAQCMWPQFYREPANPMWPLLAVSWATVAFVALLTYSFTAAPHPSKAASADN